MKATKMPTISEVELRERMAALLAQIDNLLPEFAKSCSNKEVLIIHQDSFAADYQQSEYALLGMAIKFAGLHGKEVRIIGTNRETLSPKKTEHIQ
jgi:hypothetical protein